MYRNSKSFLPNCRHGLTLVQTPAVTTQYCVLFDKILKFFSFMQDSDVEWPSHVAEPYRSQISINVLTHMGLTARKGSRVSLTYISFGPQIKYCDSFPLKAVLVELKTLQTACLALWLIARLWD